MNTLIQIRIRFDALQRVAQLIQKRMAQCRTDKVIKTCGIVHIGFRSGRSVTIISSAHANLSRCYSTHGPAAQDRARTNAVPVHPDATAESRPKYRPFRRRCSVCSTSIRSCWPSCKSDAMRRPAHGGTCRCRARRRTAKLHRLSILHRLIDAAAEPR